MKLLHLLLTPSALFVCSLPAIALPSSMSPEAKAIASRWEKLDQKCRGESGDSPATMRACDQREVVAAKMKPFGWCLAKTGQITADQAWHRCGKGSINLDGTDYIAARTSTAPASIAAPSSFIEALKGTWASTSQTCKVAHDQDQSLFFNGLKLQAEEADCIVMDSKEVGSVVRLKLVCVGEGQRTTSSAVIKFKSDKTILFENDTFRKCHD